MTSLTCVPRPSLAEMQRSHIAALALLAFALVVAPAPLPATAGASVSANPLWPGRLMSSASESAPTASALRTRVFRYRVTVNGETRWRRYQPENPGAGRRVFNIRWQMVFRDARLVVRRFPGVPVSLGLRQNRARGRVNTYYRYLDDERATPDDNRPACDIGGNYPRMAAVLSLRGNAAGRGLLGEVSLDADHVDGALSERSREAANFACPERQPGNVLGEGTDMGPIKLRGVTLNGHGNPPNTRLERHWSRPRLRSPLDDLIGGRRFLHFETGLRTQLLVNGKRSAVATCPDPGQSCEVEELAKRLEVTLRRRRF